MNLSVQLAPRHPRGLRLANPVLTASGTCGYGVELAEISDIQRLGAIVCKGTTLEPRAGNLPPRLHETASGLLNSIGLQNMGVAAVVRDLAPIWATWRVPVIVNIAGDTIAEYREVARRLEGVAGIAALEVNISCPNTEAGGMQFGASPESAARVTAAVKEVTALPVLVKLTPAADLATVARAVVQAGADALTIMNTIPGMAIDVARRAPVLGNRTGGLSGPAIKPVALYWVYEVSQKVEVPIIGCGGVATTTDALEFILAGATAVQVGTASLINPRTTLDILEGLERFLEQEQIADIAQLRGLAWAAR